MIFFYLKRIFYKCIFEYFIGYLKDDFLVFPWIGGKKGDDWMVHF